MVELQDLSFAFPGSEPCVGPLNFSVRSPGIIGFFGGNGAGKSVLAQLLAGCYPEHLSGRIHGQARILGEASLGGRRLAEQAARVQLVQQSPRLQLSGCTFSVEEEIAFGPENLCLPTAEILTRLDEALELTKTVHLRERHPSTLSGGEAQRVVIAGALAMCPRLLLLDEAFTRLTPHATGEMLSMLLAWAETHQSVVILFEKHIYPALGFCMKGVVLEHGSILAEGGAEDILPYASQAGVIIHHG
ncbi:energy-coupling factor transport system ATP-binding protein [Aeromonas sp. RU39B]|uniref:energy-coupling factor ABC transporter ATP-binding protein n=1 Tax=Aeromonas sp. RU39B TaxID=1907416 RepID=UPI00095720F3|nr:energy-coupling factor ABC transporter ATP-binding protein [Aeromonas sp. RU39B]SIQ16939.1 energy-coupling factor transport system ATP-binding protein [Aeromonas sp. RU39B]